MKAQLAMLILCGIWTATAQEHYAKGHFPPGRVFDQASVKTFIGQQVPENTYLVGKFLFLPIKDTTVYVFSTFEPSANGVVWGKELVMVRFHENIPNLHVGSVLEPDAGDPLTVRAVTLSNDKKYVLIATDSWSVPTK